MRRALGLVVILAAVSFAAVLGGRPASAQVLGGSAVNAGGRSTVPIRAPSYTSTAASGASGFACATNGCRVDFGAGASDYASSDGTTVTFAGPITGTGSVIATTALQAGSPATGAVYAGTVSPAAGNSLSIAGNLNDGATAVAVKVRSTNALSTEGAEIAAFYSDNGTTKRAAITKDGAIRLNGSAGAAPTCAAAHRGTIYYTPGGAGVADSLQVCRKDAADAYAWVALY